MPDKSSYKNRIDDKGFQFSASLEMKENNMKSKEIQESEGEEPIEIYIDAIHELVTGNYSKYTAAALKESTKSWTSPYNKPVLTHHRSSEGFMSQAEDPIGRVIGAEFLNRTKVGKPGHRLLVRISDEEAIKKVKDGRYDTVSVGGHADHAYCSICHQDWVEEGWCEHTPGRDYEESTAYLELSGLDFKEVSFVNVPADEYAGIVEKLYEDKEKEESNNKIITQESNRGGQFRMDKIEILEEKLQTKTDRVSVLEEKLTSTEEKLTNRNETVSTLEEKLQNLEDEKDLMEEEMDKILEENKKLKENQHKILANRVVEMKIKMNKISEDDKEEKFNEYVERTQESLKDTLKDLEEELEVKEEDTHEIGEELEDEGLNLKEENVDQEDETPDRVSSYFSKK